VQVWVSDQGFTDESYEKELTARVQIPVVIRPVNDRPEIKATASVLNFAQAQYCHVDFILERRNDIPGLGFRV
jgi:hypothetical protein